MFKVDGHRARGVCIALAAALAAMAAAQGQRPQPGAITVQAKPEWTDTGIDLLPGDSCTISTATGQWSNAAAPAPFSSYRGFANDRTPGLKVANRLGALIGKVGTDPPVYAGADVTIKATAHGHLLLGMNDVPGTYEDNRGYLYVSLRCDKAPVATRRKPATPTAKPTPTPTPDGRETFEPPNIKTPMPSGRGGDTKAGAHPGFHRLESPKGANLVRALQTEAGDR